MSEDRIEYEPEEKRQRAAAEAVIRAALLDRAESIMRFDTATMNDQAAALFQAYSTSQLAAAVESSNEILERLIAQLEAIEGELMKLPPRLAKIEDRLTRGIG